MPIQVLSSNKMGITALIFITLTSILSPMGIVIMAQYGLTAHFYYALVIFFFLIPSAWVFAELASAWPEEGGAYHWVTLAFGRMTGNVCLWLRWLSAVISFPTLITFSAGVVAYLVNPNLINNNFFVFWLCLGFSIFGTLFSMLGIRISSWVSGVAAIGSTLLPIALIIIFAIVWLAKGHPSQTPLLAKTMVPNFHDISTFSLLGATIFALGGMEVAAFCLKFVEKPKTQFPLAMLIATVVIIVTCVLGTLAISILVPTTQTSLIAGMMQALSVFLVNYHLQWFLYLVSAMMLLGQVAILSTLMMTLSHGLLASSKDHLLPHLFKKVNRFQVPIVILIVQGFITLGISCLYILIPDVNSAFWMIEAIMAVGIGIYYIILFVAAIRLRYSHPHTPRFIRIPGGNWGMVIVAGLPVLLCLFATITTFIPPDQFTISSHARFFSLLSVGTLLMILLPLVVGNLCLSRHKKEILAHHHHIPE